MATVKKGKDPGVLKFKVVLEKPEDFDSAALVPPFDAVEVFGTKARVPVKGTISGAPFRASLMPMGGRHMMVVNKTLRDAAKVKGGDEVEVVMSRDDEERTVEVPEDLAAALKKAKADEVWARLSFSHRKKFVLCVLDAKKPETRARRVARAVEEVLAKTSAKARRK